MTWSPVEAISASIYQYAIKAGMKAQKPHVSVKSPQGLASLDIVRMISQYLLIELARGVGMAGLLFENGEVVGGVNRIRLDSQRLFKMIARGWVAFLGENDSEVCFGFRRVGMLLCQSR